MKKDFLASIVVFLVALPLCMGIAIASGVPVSYGILSGIVGGLIVGLITGSPLQVSGPAAGLVVLVFDVVQKHGIEGLGIVTFLAGIIQLISSVFKAGPYFRAISPSVIKGMLSGIGVLIFSSQFHVMLDDRPAASAVTNIMTMPSAILKIFDTSLGVPHMEAAFIGVFTIMLILVWNNLKDRYKLVVPGALIGIVATTMVVYFAGVPINKVTLSGDFSDVFSRYFILNNLDSFSWGLVLLAFPMALVATAETLLCTNAVEKLKPGVVVDYNKELTAQGVGNTICGLFGALPITGVIVRSSANVDAGGETKVSTILHGLWLLIFVALLGSVLELIPTAALAAILVLTGVKLMNIKELIKQFSVDKTEFAIWFITIASIVGFDLLTGIAIGFGLSLLKLFISINKLEIRKAESSKGDKMVIELHGKASFLTLPTMAKSLDRLTQESKKIEIDMSHLMYRDDAFNDYILGIGETFSHRGISITIIPA